MTNNSFVAEATFNQEIKERKLNSKKLSKYVAAIDYIEKF